MNLPVFSSYPADLELNQTLFDHVLILLFAAAALAAAAVAVLAVHVKSWQANVYL
jgi:LPS O-antigen subunit length determinant protein (WzzB/FepE family)